MRARYTSSPFANISRPSGGVGYVRFLPVDGGGIGYAKWWVGCRLVV